ncbi:MAG: WD40 repeat domain-containing protein [Pseudomonadota bacterium]
MTITSGKMAAVGVAALYSSGTPILVFGDGSVVWGDNQFPPTQYGAIDAAICPSTGNLLVLGDFGFLGRQNAKGEMQALAQLDGFADKLAIGQKRELIGINTSRKTLVLSAKTGKILFDFIPPSAPISLAFDVKGENLAVGHGKGLTLYDLKTNDAPINFPASGGVFATSFSPDLRFLIAATGEPCLVGWRLQDGKGFRMAGYPQKPISLAWLDGGARMATSGAPVMVVWPFEGENGPMGQNAATFRGRSAIINVVAAQKNLAALGYLDGSVDVFDFTDNEFHAVSSAANATNQDDRNSQTERITSIAMPRNAKSVAWVSESGGWGIAEFG